jgi:hypothetical protein
MPVRDPLVSILWQQSYIKEEQLFELRATTVKRLLTERNIFLTVSRRGTPK